MDYKIDITAEEFLITLDAALARLDTVQPRALQAPLDLWFRSVAEEAKRQGWKTMFGRPVIPVWNAARAILDQPSTKDSSKWVVDPHRDFGPRPRPNSQENNR